MEKIVVPEGLHHRLDRSLPPTFWNQGNSNLDVHGSFAEQCSCTGRKPMCASFMHWDWHCLMCACLLCRNLKTSYSSCAASSECLGYLHGSRWRFTRIHFLNFTHFMNFTKFHEFHELSWQPISYLLNFMKFTKSSGQKWISWSEMKVRSWISWNSRSMPQNSGKCGNVRKIGNVKFREDDHMIHSCG